MRRFCITLFHGVRLLLCSVEALTVRSFGAICVFGLFPCKFHSCSSWHCGLFNDIRDAANLWPDHSCGLLHNWLKAFPCPSNWRNSCFVLFWSNMCGLRMFHIGLRFSCERVLLVDLSNWCNHVSSHFRSNLCKLRRFMMGLLFSSNSIPLASTCSLDGQTNGYGRHLSLEIGLDLHDLFAISCATRVAPVFTMMARARPCLAILFLCRSALTHRGS
mmetsp:Transcript_105798/g.210249  ORF Transcript_105798/g.210249 Transcript_105798/m.210249 type:complete len:217 (+) Transcript_105798:862-1512(+)